LLIFILSIVKKAAYRGGRARRYLNYVKILFPGYLPGLI